jgi:hypothetical protein
MDGTTPTPISLATDTHLPRVRDQIPIAAHARRATTMPPPFPARRRPLSLSLPPSGQRSSFPTFCRLGRPQPSSSSARGTYPNHLLLRRTTMAPFELQRGAGGPPSPLPQPPLVSPTPVRSIDSAHRRLTFPCSGRFRVAPHLPTAAHGFCRRLTSSLRNAGPDGAPVPCIV